MLVLKTPYKLAHGLERLAKTLSILLAMLQAITTLCGVLL